MNIADLANRKPLHISSLKPETQPRKVVSSLPKRRQSFQPSSGRETYIRLKGELKFITPEFNRDVIPLIRKLSKTNPEVGLAKHDVIRLVNTGHKAFFSPEVPAEQVDKMRLHLKRVSKNWISGINGVNSLVNRLVAQLVDSGAIAVEWTVNRSRDGIKNGYLLPPEDIIFALKGNEWAPYQRGIDAKTHDHKIIALNPNSFKYYALDGDNNIPYGIPPYLNVIEALATQKTMMDNISHITKMMGVAGFLETRVEKPNQDDHESDGAYGKRLERFLEEIKERTEDGYYNGSPVGFKEDHEFEFHSTNINAAGLDSLYDKIQVSVANALKHPPVFMGIEGSGTESGMGVVFTKMLSQLRNYHEILSSVLEHVYSIELMLAGFKFKSLSVKFNQSTITDDLKFQQAREYRIRNNRTLYSDGIISLDHYAEDMGQEKPDQKEPRNPIDPDGVMQKEEQRKKREEGKDKSDRRGRDKSKPVAKRKDRDTRER